MSNTLAIAQLSIEEALNATPPVPVTEIDYTTLDELLRTGQWQAADLETKAVMLRIIGRDDYLPGGAIDEFSCEHLDMINQLWVRRSGNRFGFSVQVRILQEVEGNWERFGDRVGWRVNQVWLQKTDRCYNLQAPEGHLPCSAIRSAGTGSRARTRILKRFAACELSEF